MASRAVEKFLGTKAANKGIEAVKESLTRHAGGDDPPAGHTPADLAEAVRSAQTSPTVTAAQTQMFEKMEMGAGRGSPDVGRPDVAAQSAQKSASQEQLQEAVASFGKEHQQELAAVGRELASTEAQFNNEVSHDDVNSQGTPGNEWKGQVPTMEGVKSASPAVERFAGKSPERTADKSLEKEEPEQ